MIEPQEGNLLQAPGPITDLDETRRLLYGALAASRTGRWELVGTLANALLHHSGLVAEETRVPKPDALVDRLVAVVEGHGNHAWVLSLIGEATRRIEALAANGP